MQWTKFGFLCQVNYSKLYRITFITVTFLQILWNWVRIADFIPLVTLINLFDTCIILFIRVVEIFDKQPLVSSLLVARFLSQL